MPFAAAACSRRPAALLAAVIAWLAAPLLGAQQGTPPAADQAQAGPEIASRKETVTFKAAVQLVTIPVVVRDAQGRAVAHLTKDDFQVFDNNKPQVITKFSVEHSDGAEGRTTPGAGRGPGSSPSRPAASVPERYIAYIFDDLHLGAADAMRVRDAASKRLAATLRPAERAAIYTTSGMQPPVDFTADQDLLQAGLAKLMPRHRNGDSYGECPEISLYQADRIVNKMDKWALDAAVSDAKQCNPGASQDTLIQIATMAARRVLNAGDEDARLGLTALQDAIRSLEVRAGQRSIILVSPGFLKPGAQLQANELMQYAIQSKVTINALDARGLWTDPSLDASKGHANPDSMIERNSLAQSSASAEANVMAELAAGTGGRFFENSNDLESGFQQLAAAPEFVYVLGFAPQNLKLDGKYHPLKVKLAAPKGLNVQARLGYFAPKRLNDAVEQAKEEIRNAVFSREELSELPVELLARAFKQPAGKSQIIVWARVSLKDLKLRLADGRSSNEVRLLAAVFDANGKMVAGQEQVLDLKMTDATLAMVRENGITLRSDFIVKPGPYLVRTVLRDAEGQQITAQNSSIDAP